MDEWTSWITQAILGMMGQAQQAQQNTQDEARIKRETTREVTSDGRFVRTTTLSMIQEGEFEEIEDAETGEIVVREPADQASDRREEILSDEADED